MNDVAEADRSDAALDAGRLSGVLGEHRRWFVLTGAGCSTQSGIPAYRDESGAEIWFRELVLLYQDEVPLQSGQEAFHCLNPAMGCGAVLANVSGGVDPDTTGHKAFNYRAEPIWARLGLAPDTRLGTVAGLDVSASVSIALAAAFSLVTEPRQSLALLAGAFMAHALIDVAHRPGWLSPAIAPRWFTVGCAAYDVYLAALCYWARRR